MYFYTYVLLSLKDDQLYIGYTSNLDARIKNHNEGFVKSTQNRLPLKLVYFEGCLDKKSAIQREKQLKTGFGRAYLHRRLSI